MGWMVSIPPRFLPLACALLPTIESSEEGGGPRLNPYVLIPMWPSLGGTQALPWPIHPREHPIAAHSHEFGFPLLCFVPGWAA